MKKMTIALLFSFWIFTGCSSEPEFKKVSAKKTQMEEVSEDIQIPSKIWDQLEEIFLAPLDVFDRKKFVDSTKIPKNFITFTVYLVEKTKGVLGGGNHEIKFPLGGGTLDLARYVKKVRGSFYIGIETIPADLQKEIQVYYVGGARKRRVDNQILGSGCSQYMDLTKFYRKSMKKDGILVNTSNQRYISLLAGNYVFGIRHEDVLQITQLTIEDSRYPTLHCERNSKSMAGKN